MAPVETHEEHTYETLLRIQYGESEGERIRNDVEVRFRGDWKSGEERWGLFSDTRFRIDEFQNFDTRLTESLGGTYQIYENEGEKKYQAQKNATRAPKRDEKPE